MRYILLFLLIACPVTVYAATECVDIDVSAWTQEQKNHLEATAYRVVFLAGHNETPDSVQKNSGRVCWKDPGFDVSTVVTQQAVEDRFTADKAARQAEGDAIRTRILEVENELTTNDFCDYTFNQVRAWFAARNTQNQQISDLATAKAFNTKVLSGLEKLVRCIAAREELREGL